MTGLGGPIWFVTRDSILATDRAVLNIFLQQLGALIEGETFELLPGGIETLMAFFIVD